MPRALHPGTAFQVTISFTEHDTVVELAGELDLAGCPSLALAAEGVASAARSAVTIDLAGLDFVDVAGSRTLAGACETLDTAGCPLSVQGVGPRVARSLTLTGYLQPLLYAA